MKFYALLIFFCTSLAFSENLEPTPVPIGMEKEIQNAFGLQHPISGTILFQPYIGIFSENYEVANLDDGKLIYFDNSQNHFIPSSYGDNSLVVIEDSKNRQLQYAQFQLSSDVEKKSFKSLTKSSILGKTKAARIPFSFSVNRENSFENPLKALDFPLEEARSKTIILPGILLESGIYRRYVRSSQFQRIPLRKNYTIYINAYEKTAGDNIRALPSKLQVNIRNIQKQTIVFHGEIEFRGIKNNKMNGLWTPSELYRKWSMIPMIKIGVWDHMERMDSYEINVLATGSSGDQTTLQFSLEFN